MIFKKLNDFFEARYYRDNINTLDTLLTRLDFKNNFDGQHFDITINARSDWSAWSDAGVTYTSGSSFVIAPDGNAYSCISTHLNIPDPTRGFYEHFLYDYLTLGYWQTINDDTTIKHNLGKIPSGFLVYNQSAGGLILKGDTAWTSQNIYLKNQSPVDANVKLMVFR